MRTSALAALALAACTARADPEDEGPLGPSCAFMLREVEQLLAERGTIPMTVAATRVSHNTPGDPCHLPPDLREVLEGASAADTRVCTISGQKLAVRRTGPEGSGRWWFLAVGASTPQGEVAGACIEAATTAWRNIPPEVTRAASTPRWDPCPEDVPGRLELWDSIRSFPGADVTSYVLVRVVYELRDGRLVVDRDATRQRAASLAAFYRATARTSRNSMHVTAAEMLEAFSTGGKCRPERDRPRRSGR